MQRPIPTNEDIHINNVIEGFQCFSQRSPCWGLYWIDSAVFKWHVWMERNQHHHQNEAKLVVVLVKLLIGNIDILFLNDEV